MRTYVWYIIIPPFSPSLCGIISNKNLTRISFNNVKRTIEEDTAITSKFKATMAPVSGRCSFRTSRGCFPRTRGKQMDEPLQIGPRFRTQAVSRVSSVVLLVYQITCKFDLGRATSRRERRRTAGQSSGLNSVAGHSRKHSRYYGSAKPRADAPGLESARAVFRSAASPGIRVYVHTRCV